MKVDLVWHELLIRAKETTYTMSLIRYQSQLPVWSPFDRLSSLRDEVNRLFDLSLPGDGHDGTLFSGWSPALDVYQDDDHLFVKIELPGMKKEEMQISLHENTLTVSGERKNERETKEGEAFRSERFFGRFHRSVTLPTPVDPKEVKAQYKEGVLTVTLNKAEEAKPRQIEIQPS